MSTMRYFRSSWGHIHASTTDLTVNGTSNVYTEIPKDEYLAEQKRWNDTHSTGQQADLTYTRRNKLKRLAKKRGVTPRVLAGRWLTQMLDSMEG